MTNLTSIIILKCILKVSIIFQFYLLKIKHYFESLFDSEVTFMNMSNEIIFFCFFFKCGKFLYAIQKTLTFNSELYSDFIFYCFYFQLFCRNFFCVFEIVGKSDSMLVAILCNNDGSQFFD